MRLYFAFLLCISLTLTNGIGQGKPLLQIDNASRDAGTIQQGDIIRQVFVFTNKGSGTLQILDVSHS